MGGLQNFENRLEQLISGVFARAFRSAVQPVEISAALQREVDNNAQILSRDRRLVPNSFHVELSEGDLERLSPYDSAMAEELTNALRDHADQQSYVFPGPVSIAFEGADDLTTGRFRVRSKAIAKVTHNATNTQVGRARALLVVNGVRHPLDPPGLVVGRGTDADLRINDPGVSRRHIEYHVDNSGHQVRLAVRDLGSTNGMLVDGAKVPEAALHDGSTVKIGNTTMTVQVVTSRIGPTRREPMSELTLFLIRIAYLAILWIFVLSAISGDPLRHVRRPGRRRGGAGRSPEGPAEGGQATDQRRGSPTHLAVVDGTNADSGPSSTPRRS